MITINVKLTFSDMKSKGIPEVGHFLIGADEIYVFIVTELLLNITAFYAWLKLPFTRALTCHHLFQAYLKL